MSWFEYEMSLATSCKLGARLTRDWVWEKWLGPGSSDPISGFIMQCYYWEMIKKNKRLALFCSHFSSAFWQMWHHLLCSSIVPLCCHHGGLSPLNLNWNNDSLCLSCLCLTFACSYVKVTNTLPLVAFTTPNFKLTSCYSLVWIFYLPKLSMESEGIELLPYSFEYSLHDL